VDQDLKIKIKIDADSGELIIARSEFNEITRSAARASSAVGGFRQAIDIVAHSTQALVNLGAIFGGVTAAITSAAKAGIQYNATLEQTRLALKATIAGYVEAATTSDKLAGAQALAESSMDKLQILAKESGLAFGELSAAFKTFLPGALRTGMSLDQAASAASRLTQAAKLMGLETGALLAGIDGVAQGTILANSDFGRFLSGVGLTSEALKEAAQNGKTYELIMNSLSAASAAGSEANKTFAGATGALSATIAEIRGEMAKPIFEAQTAALISFNEFLTKNRETLLKIPGVLAPVAKGAIALGAGYAAIKVSALAFAAAQGALNAQAAAGAVRMGAARVATIALNTAMSVNPIMAAIGAFASLITYLNMTKSAAIDTAKAYDQMTLSQGKYADAELAVMERDLVAKMRKLNAKIGEAMKPEFSYLNAIAGTSTNKLSLEEEAKLAKLKRSYNELEAQLKEIRNAQKGIFEAPKTEEITLLKPEVTIDKKELKDAQKSIDGFLEKYREATLAPAELVRAKFAAYSQELTQSAKELGLSAGEISDIVAKLNEMERIELVKIKRDEYQKIVDESIRANSALEKIENLAIDNAVLRGEITEEEANRKKQILGYETEIMNIEKQIAALNSDGDATRIAELEKTKALLSDQKELKAKEIIPSDLQKSLADNFADAITQGLIDGLKNGESVAKSILSATFNSVGSALINNFSQTLSRQLSSAFAGGGFDMGAIGSSAAGMGIGIGLSAIASELTAKWELVSSRDIMQEIADHTADAALSLRAVAALNRRFGTNYDATIPPSLLTGDLRGAGYKSGGSAAIKDLITSWTSDFYDNNIERPFLVAVEKYKKKTLFGTKTKTKEIYAIMTEATAEAVAFLKQFGGDNYGNLTTEGIKKFTEAFGAIFSIFDEADRFVASITGINLAEYDYQSAADRWANAQSGYQEYVDMANAQIDAINEQISSDKNRDPEYQAQIEALKKSYEQLSGAGLSEEYYPKLRKMREEWERLEAQIANGERDLIDALPSDLNFDPRNMAELLNEEFLAELIGALGKDANVEEITAMFDELQAAAQGYIDAMKAYANAEMERIKSEASFIEWLESAEKAIDAAGQSLRDFIGDLRSLANQARSLANSDQSKDYYQRLYASARSQVADMYDENGALRGDLSAETVKEIWASYLEAAQGLQGAAGDYDYALKEALQAGLNAAADAMDFSADILSVRIVGDNADLATNTTINDLIAALTPALSLDQIGFSGTSDATKRALALASGAKTQEELDRLIEAIAALRFGDDASDKAYLDNLATLAEYDASAARLMELLEKAQANSDLSKRSADLQYEMLKQLIALRKSQERQEYAQESA
jgi:hypothetical protein